MKRILVVDDDPEIVEFIRLGLESFGFEVTSASDGEEGVEKAQKIVPDLIVLDLAMPRMHGYEVCQKVKEDTALAATKIIVTSGKSYPVDIRTAKEAGADQYIVKPYSIQQLVEAIQRLLGAG